MRSICGRRWNLLFLVWLRMLLPASMFLMGRMFHDRDNGIDWPNAHVIHLSDSMYRQECGGTLAYHFRVPFIASGNRRPGRIVISGLGCVTPLGNSRSELWDGFANAKSGVRRIAAFDPSSFPVQIAGEVRGIDPYQIISPKERQ